MRIKRREDFLSGLFFKSRPEGKMLAKKVVSVICAGVFYLLASQAAVLQGNQDGGGNSIAGRGLDFKGMLAGAAENLTPRGYITAPGGSSQVISLNITNLLVLVLLKALIFAAGSIGAGHWKNGYGRSLEGENGEDGGALLNEEELLLFLGYLTGRRGNDGCLKLMACQQPEKAKRYAAAGATLWKIAGNFLEPDLRYKSVLEEIQEAAEAGIAGGDCSAFPCGK